MAGSKRGESVVMLCFPLVSGVVFFFNDAATTEIYPLSLHDALPILPVLESRRGDGDCPVPRPHQRGRGTGQDRKSTRLNSSHHDISYAVFFLEKNNFESVSFSFLASLLSILLILRALLQV